MLSALSIKNIVLIEHLDMELSNSLSVLSGETGAGKSILLDALALALGGRGDSSLVRKGQESGVVSAEIHLSKDHAVHSILQEAAIDTDNNLVLKRVQYLDGRTRAFINDQPVSVSLLRKIGALIVEIHGQHDDRALIDVSTHRQALDEFAALKTLVEKLNKHYDELIVANNEVSQLELTIAKAKQDEEYARHVVKELLDLSLEEGEEAALSEQRQKLMQLEAASSEISDIDEILYGKSAPAPIITSLVRRLARKSTNNNDQFAPILEGLDNVLLALENSSETLEILKRDIDFNPQQLENIEERLFALRATARKHEVRVDQLTQILEKYQAELTQLETGESELQKLRAIAKKANSDYLQVATELSKKRNKNAKNLEKAVAKELPDLKLGNAKFIVDHQVEHGRISPSGFDQINFHVQTNQGTNAGPLHKVASGGELSRFLLALKVVLAEKGSAPVLIFDEIDSGVGGAVADAIGRRLARLAQSVQVFSITHAPQVAARAKNHLLIEKLSSPDGKTMRTSVKILNEEQRQEEVARMLAGAQISDEARAAAMRLLSD